MTTQNQCIDCHQSASKLRFEPLSIECIHCHNEDYQAAVNPNHILGNFSTNCNDCHSMNAFTWGGSGFNHAFFSPISNIDFAKSTLKYL